MSAPFVRSLLGRIRGDDPLIRDLKAVLGRGRVENGPAALNLYSRDASVTRGGHAGIVCFPENTAEVSACVATTALHGRPFVPRGAGTGLSGGAVPCDEPVMVVTTRMDTIHEVDVERRLAWVGPGVVNLDLSLHRILDQIMRDELQAAGAGENAPHADLHEVGVDAEFHSIRWRLYRPSDFL